MRISRDRYARLYGPTAGDRFRLADTDLVADAWLAGRPARGEIHQYNQLSFATTASRLDGSLLFRDSLRFEPAVYRPDTAGLLGDALAVGSYFLVGPAVSERLEPVFALRLRETLPVRAAVSRPPGGVGPFIRVLAGTSDELRTVQRDVLTTAGDRLFERGIGEPYKP